MIDAYERKSLVDRTRWAYEQAARHKLTAIQFSIYHHIVWRDSGYGCWQSHKSMMRQLHIGRRNTVISSIQHLERLGLITVERTAGAVTTIYMTHPASKQLGSPRAPQKSPVPVDDANEVLDSVADTYTRRELENGDYEGFPGIRPVRVVQVARQSVGHPQGMADLAHPPRPPHRLAPRAPTSPTHHRSHRATRARHGRRGRHRGVLPKLQAPPLPPCSESATTL